MKRVSIKRFVSLVTLGVALVAAPLVGSTAQAADLKVLIVNQKGIFQSSLAGKDQMKKLQAIFKAIGEDEAKELEPLKLEAIDLQKKRAILGDEFGKKSIELQKKVEFTRYKFEQERNVTQERAQRILVQSLYPIFNEIMQEKKGTMLIDQSQVIMTSPDFNITEDVVKRLDAKMPTADVKRVTFAEIAQAIEAQRKQVEAEKSN
jgi:Skp family chaperone for outer membrane proteins